ncbi:hypothetical protein IKS_03675 [Bacillus cereus VDM062]|nr:hypothetical protein IKS_03675 [Bacillus cereus VDM062]
MKIDITLPDTDLRARDHLRYILFCNKFHGISIVKLCEDAGLHFQQWKRAILGTSSYRSQCSVAHRLIERLPFKVTEDIIQESLTLMDAIADKLKELESMKGGDMND